MCVHLTDRTGTAGLRARITVLHFARLPPPPHLRWSTQRQRTRVKDVGLLGSSSCLDPRGRGFPGPGEERCRLLGSSPGEVREPSLGARCGPCPCPGPNNAREAQKESAQRLSLWKVFYVRLICFLTFLTGAHDLVESTLPQEVGYC